MYFNHKTINLYKHYFSIQITYVIRQNNSRGYKIIACVSVTDYATA